MKREEGMAVLGRRDQVWDILVVGGGATGLGAAVDSASRGLKTLLVERGDFACGTSSRSTKLIHGGVRYLKQGNIGLVREGLKERGLLIRNAPDWVKPLAFVIPVRSRWESAFYRLGLGFYDLLAGGQGLERARTVGWGEMRRCFPRLSLEHGRCGVRYVDGQFDDARFAVRLAEQAVECGAVVVNYVAWESMERSGAGLMTVLLRDVETGHAHEVQARIVINATGIFSDELKRKMDERAEGRLRFSQGAHVVLDREYLSGDAALMIPRTEDGRVLFAIPWHGRVLFGTTDVPVGEAAVRPRPMKEEIDYLLRHASSLFGMKVDGGEVRSCFAGIRPLLDWGGVGSRSTASLSRDHRIEVSGGGLVTIAGGKWTSYRRMAEEVVDCAVRAGGLSAGKSRTVEMRLGGVGMGVGERSEERMVEGLPWVWGDVERACEREMARRVEDVLARRTRLLFTDVEGALAVAPRVARMLAAARGLGTDWVERELEAFHGFAQDFKPL